MSPPLRTKEFERILLIKPSALGDVVHTIPLLVKLRARYPKAQIDWLLSPQNAELLRCHPALSNVVLFDRHGIARFGRSWSAAAGLIKLLKQIRRERYDLAIPCRSKSTTFDSAGWQRSSSAFCGERSQSICAFG